MSNSRRSASLDSQILAIVNAIDYAPVTTSILAKSMQITKSQFSAFKDVLATLIESGRIRQDKKGRLRPRGSTGLVSGILRKISSGAAYVIPSQKDPTQRETDIDVAPRDVRDAQTGDDVLVRISAKRRANGQRCGIIEKWSNEPQVSLSETTSNLAVRDLFRST